MMRMKRHWHGLAAPAADVLAILVLAGFAAKTATGFASGTTASGSSPAGLVLEYKMPAGRPGPALYG